MYEDLLVVFNCSVYEPTQLEIDHMHEVKKQIFVGGMPGYDKCEAFNPRDHESDGERLISLTRVYKQRN